MQMRTRTRSHVTFPRLALAGALLCALALSGGAALAVPPRFADTLPLSRIHEGMEGYGLTTFHGTTISRFHVRVLGILRKVNNGRDLVLVKLSGGPITALHANLIEGMSGSPIYLNGRVAGAFSMGEKFGREPIGMMTPIQDMLDSWDPDIPQKPKFYVPARPGLRPADAFAPVRGQRLASIRLSRPLAIGDRTIRRVVLDPHPADRLASTAGVAVLRPASQLLSFGGANSSLCAWLQKGLASRGYNVVVRSGPGAGAERKLRGVTLRPGSAFGAWLATGDVMMGGTGTITYRRGNRILAFGHPLMGLGAVNAAISTAYILGIFPALDVSHHIAEPGPIVGTLSQDRDFSVSGAIGPMPGMVPFTCTVVDHTMNRRQVFHARFFENPNVTPLLMEAAARELISRVHDVPGDVMAHVTTTVDAPEVGAVTRSDEVFDPTDISTAASGDLRSIADALSANPFYPLPIRSASVTVDITGGHNTASIERIFLTQDKFVPGDTMQVGVEIKPYLQPSFTTLVPVRIPTNTPNGKYPLVVRGGAPMVTHLGPFIITAQTPDLRTPPVNVRQVVSRLLTKEHDTDMVAQLQLNSSAPAIDGEKLAQLPPNLAALMHSEDDSGVRLERDMVQEIVPTGYVVSGSQQLMVTVEQKASGDGAPRPPALPSTLVVQSSDQPEPSATKDEQADSAAQDEDPGEDGAGDSGGDTARLRVHALQRTGTQPAPKTGVKGKSAPEAAGPPAPPADNSSTALQTQAPAPVEPAIKPVARASQTWRQEATEMVNGTFDGVSVTTSGSLEAAPSLRKLARTGEIYVWSIAPGPENTLYAGTGSNGKILQVWPDGKSDAVATLPCPMVQCLLPERDGALLAGSGTTGQIYRVTPGSQPVLACSLPEPYVLAMVQDRSGRIYAAAGGGGTVYRLDIGAGGLLKATPILNTGADHVLALAVDASGNLYAGTDGPGAIYRLTAQGKREVVFDDRTGSVTALAVDAQGALWAGTGPHGALVRIGPGGSADQVVNCPATFFTAISPAPDGSLYASTVASIYHIELHREGQPTVQPIVGPPNVTFLTARALPDGGVVAATGIVGDIYTSRAASANSGGEYVSIVHDAGVVSRWGVVRVDMALPVAGTGAALAAETRTGDVPDPDATWSAWTPVTLSGYGEREGAIQSPPARFIQYRLRFPKASGSAGPAVRAVALTYLTQNRPPTLTVESPAGGDRWAGDQAIRWTGRDPDGDTLEYKVEVSSDGLHWSPIKGSKQPKLQLKLSPSSAAAMPANIRELIDHSADLAAVQNGWLAGATAAWDTRSVPDGAYWIRVTASDAPSNPEGGLTATAVSDTVIICNTPPALVAASAPAATSDGTVLLQGSVTQPLIEVTAVQFRVDDGPWTAASPQGGGLFLQSGGFSIHTLPLAAGQHTLEIAAINAAGLKTVRTLKLMVSQGAGGVRTAQLIPDAVR